VFFGGSLGRSWPPLAWWAVVVHRFQCACRERLEAFGDR
jgi:hypothetical protein